MTDEVTPEFIMSLRDKTNKPKVKLTGQDGNIFNLVGVASKALKKAGMQDDAKHMSDEVFKAHSYDEALAIICKYVDAS
jgi:hypothetical protein